MDHVVRADLERDERDLPGMGFQERGMGKQMRKGCERVFLRMTRELEPAPEPSGTFIQSWLAAWWKARGERKGA